LAGTLGLTQTSAACPSVAPPALASQGQSAPDTNVIVERNGAPLEESKAPPSVDPTPELLDDDEEDEEDVDDEGEDDEEESGSRTSESAPLLAPDGSARVASTSPRASSHSWVFAPHPNASTVNTCARVFGRPISPAPSVLPAPRAGYDAVRGGPVLETDAVRSVAEASGEPLGPGIVTGRDDSVDGSGLQSNTRRILVGARGFEPPTPTVST
jgi:hypothetical protein